MRIVYFGNNLLGWRLLEWLQNRGELIVGLVVHPPERQKFRAEMIDCMGVPDSCVLDGSRLRETEVLVRLHEMKPDLGVSVLFGYIIKPDLLRLFPRGIINLHLSYLPYNRGAHPNVWSIVDGTPAGVSIHYINSGVDTGDILAQEEVAVEPIDTGRSLYEKLELSAFNLFTKSWEGIKSGELHSQKQNHDIATVHQVRDLAINDEIDLDRTYTGRELINILRARTFPPYRGACFRVGNRRVYLRLNLEYGD